MCVVYNRYINLIIQDSLLGHLLIGRNNWAKQLGETVGRNNWAKQLVKQLGETIGRNNWSKQLAETIGRNNLSIW